MGAKDRPNPHTMAKIMSFNTLDQAVQTASDQTYALDQSAHITSDGRRFFVEGVDPNWNEFRTVLTIAPTHLARRVN